MCSLEGASSAQEATTLLNWKSDLLNQNNPILTSWNLQPSNGSNSTEPSTTSPCTWFGILCLDDVKCLGVIPLKF